MMNNIIKEKLKKSGSTWLTIVNSFRDNVSDWPQCKMTPAEFVRHLQREDKLEKQDMIDAFAIVCLEKDWDERIYPECRDYLRTHMDKEIYQWFITTENRERIDTVFRYFSRMDDIHSTHINQTVEALMNNKW